MLYCVLTDGFNFGDTVYTTEAEAMEALKNVDMGGYSDVYECVMDREYDVWMKDDKGLIKFPNITLEHAEKIAAHRGLKVVQYRPCEQDSKAILKDCRENSSSLLNG